LNSEWILHHSKINSRTVYFFKANQQSNTLIGKISVLGFQKGAYYSGIKFFNKLPLEIKNVAGNQKNFYTLTYFTQLKSTLVNRELRTDHKILL